MKDITFETKIVAANPFSSRNTFVKATMKQVRHEAPKKRNWFAAKLHRPAFALAVVVGLVVCSGAVYAAVQVAPALLQFLSKETSYRGTTEYAVSGFTECAKSNATMPNTQRFEIKKGANLSDEEARKIIQAKCELAWIQDYVGTKWPSSNLPSTGVGTIYMTRTDMPGTFQSGNDQEIQLDIGGYSTAFTAVAGEKIQAFIEGKEIPLSNITPGEAVLTVSRSSQNFVDPQMAQPKPGQSVSYNSQNTDYKELGVVAVFKLSLPREYYTEKQNYLTDLPTCVGNNGELCPNTPTIDVFPRAGGEGATNPDHMDDPESMHREISGVVTELGSNTLTLQSRSGRIYRVTVGDAGFTIYNRDYASNYNNAEATLKVGSSVSVRYSQRTSDDPTLITKQQVISVVLQLEALNPKSDPLKAY